VAVGCEEGVGGMGGWGGGGGVGAGASRQPPRAPRLAPRATAAGPAPDVAEQDGPLALHGLHAQRLGGVAVAPHGSMAPRRGDGAHTAAGGAGAPPARRCARSGPAARPREITLRRRHPMGAPGAPPAPVRRAIGRRSGDGVEAGRMGQKTFVWMYQSLPWCRGLHRGGVPVKLGGHHEAIGAPRPCSRDPPAPLVRSAWHNGRGRGQGAKGARRARGGCRRPPFRAAGLDRGLLPPPGGHWLLAAALRRTRPQRAPPCAPLGRPLCAAPRPAGWPRAPRPRLGGMGAGLLAGCVGEYCSGACGGACGVARCARGNGLWSVWVGWWWGGVLLRH
jgi:hypothetical protein